MKRRREKHFQLTARGIIGQAASLRQNPEAPFIFHFPYNICHLPLPEPIFFNDN
jgi:hypothetical protein